MAQPSKTRKVFDNRYEILSIVGRGQCSVVYHARHVMSPTSEVALKVLLADKDSHASNTERLRREALAMVSSRHRFVIRLDDFHSVGDLCYLSMEYAPGSDLRKYLTKAGAPLSAHQGQSFLIQIAEALAFMHSAGIVHRDVKPDNLLVINDAEVRLGDFGVALLPGMENSLDELQRGVGTMNYMAPEVLEGISYDARSDLYALGVTFYEVIAGAHPFESAPLIEQLNIRKDGQFEPLENLVPGISPRLSQAITRLMRYDAAARFQNARDLVEFLQNENIALEEPSRPAEQAIIPVPGMRVSAAKKAEKTPPPTEDIAPAVTSPAPAPAVTSDLPIEPSTKSSAEPAPSTEAPKEPNDAPQKAPLVEQVERSVEPSSPQDFPVPASPPPSNQPVRLDSSQPVPKSGGYEPKAVSRGGSLASRALITQDDGSAARQRETEAEAIPPEVTEQGHAAPGLTELGQADSHDEPEINAEVVDVPAEPTETAAARAFKQRSRTVRVDKSTVDRLRARDKNKEPAMRAPNDLKRRFFFTAGIALVLMTLFGAHLFLKKRYNFDIAAIVTGGSASSASISVPLTYPDLPSGIYSGTATGLIGDQTVPLTILSFRRRSALVVIVGIEGWSPAVVPIETGANPIPAKPLRIASNGFLLQWNGGVEGDVIQGSFKNLLTGNEGSWQARPTYLAEQSSTSKGQ